MSQNPRSYTTIDVAKRLGVSLQTVQRWVDAGHLKAWKTLGGHRRIDAASAELLFQAQDERIGGAPAAYVGTATDADALKVLVVDDNPLDLQLLVTLVQQALPEATVETAVNGFQGLMVIGRLAPAIIVTDINMPHMDGFEMLRSLMLNDTVRPRLLVAVSARTAAELAGSGHVPDGVTVLTKPLDQARFIQVLRDAA